MTLLGRTLAAALVVSMSIALAACGSDDGDTAKATGDKSAKADTPAKVDKSPIKFFGIIDVTTPPGTNSQVENFRMAVKAVNSQGGIKGHPIDFEVCDSATNPNATISCARKAVAARAAAVVSYAVNGGTYTEVLEAAKIPLLGPGLFGPSESTSKFSFPVLGGGIAAVAGYAAVAKRAGCKSVSYVADAPPAYASVIKSTTAIFEAKAKALGIKSFKPILATPGSPDFTSYMTAAARQGSDCTIVQPIPSDLVAMIKAAKSASDSKVIVANGQFDATSVKSLGNQLDGIWVDDIAWPIEAAKGHAGVEQFVKDLHQFNPKRVPTADTADMVGWTAVRLFAYAAARVDEVDAASIVAQLNQTNDYDSGVAPPISYGKGVPKDALAPRIFQTAIVVGKYNGPKVEPLGFFNIGTGEPVEFPSQLAK
jgi:ABC-type branched-subunit amino acid transport system substrate-binding protein